MSIQNKHPPYIHSYIPSTLLTDLQTIKHLINNKLIQLTHHQIEQIQIYEKMIKFINNSSINQSNNNNGSNSNSNETNNINKASTKIQNKRPSTTSLANQTKYKTNNSNIQNNINQHQKHIEDNNKKITDLQANKLFTSLYEDIGQFIAVCYYKFRRENSDIYAFFAKEKYMLFSNDSSSGNNQLMNNVTDIMQKYASNNNNNSNNINIQQQQYKDKLLYHKLNTLTSKAATILSQLPYYKKLQKQNKQNKQNNNNILAQGYLNKIINQICKYYNIVPYHNFTHGFSVFISFYQLYQLISNNNQNSSTNNNRIDDFTLFYALIACLSHDIGHPGNNTLFEVNNKSQLAITYGNISVMQKMHLSKTMDILSRNKQTNQLFNQILTVTQQSKVRKVISRAILATDMSKHYGYVEKLDIPTLFTSLQNQQQQNNTKKQEQQLILTQILIHSCDVQNPTYSYTSYLQWANLICLQFHNQTLKQNKLNLQITQFLKFDSLNYFYRNQISFVSSIVLPLWSKLQDKFIQIKQKKNNTMKIKQNLEKLKEMIRRNSQNTGANHLNESSMSNLKKQIVFSKNSKNVKMEEFVNGRLRDFIIKSNHSRNISSKNSSINHSNSKISGNNINTIKGRFSS